MYVDEGRALRCDRWRRTLRRLRGWALRPGGRPPGYDRRQSAPWRFSTTGLPEPSMRFPPTIASMIDLSFVPEPRSRPGNPSTARGCCYGEAMLIWALADVKKHKPRNWSLDADWGVVGYDIISPSKHLLSECILMRLILGGARFLRLLLCLGFALSLGGCFAGNLVGGDLPAIAYIVSDEDGAHAWVKQPGEDKASRISSLSADAKTPRWSPDSSR